VEQETQLVRQAHLQEAVYCVSRPSIIRHTYNRLFIVSVGHLLFQQAVDYAIRPFIVSAGRADRIRTLAVEQHVEQEAQLVRQANLQEAVYYVRKPFIVRYTCIRPFIMSAGSLLCQQAVYYVSRIFEENSPPCS
jgi:hypothetical protein